MSSIAIANLFYERGDFVGAIPLYEACIIDLKHARGDFSAGVFSSMEKLAICHSNMKKYNKAILVNDERFRKMSLFYGDYYPETLSALYSLAQDFSNIGDFGKSVSLHEDCFTRRQLLLGVFHELTCQSSGAIQVLKSKKHDSSSKYTSTTKSAAPSFSPFAFGLELPNSSSPPPSPIAISSAATANVDASSLKVAKGTIGLGAVLSQVESTPESTKISESPYNKMRIKDLIELIDHRKLNRVGLQEKSELAQLLCSNTSVVEKRGVTLKLFRAYRQLALSRNADASFWTIAHVSAMINGSHEIFKADCRFDKVDPNSTLTFDDKCPLIDVLLFKNFDSNNKHPLLNLSYKEAVGERANLFLSFAYQDNFIDLVDTLELYLETHSKDYPVDTTYFWFDLFINNQWTASDKPFEFWADIFEKTVNEIGHTLCFLSPWENPTILTRVWCLLEMRYSPRISIILSRKEVLSFQNVLSEGYQLVGQHLCKIKAENATSFRPEDRNRIFRLIESMEGGFHEFNVKVMGLIRDWVASSAEEIVATSGKSSSRSSSNFSRDHLRLTRDKLGEMRNTAILLQDQGKLGEAKILYERALLDSERLLGHDNECTLQILNSLALLLMDFRQLDESRKLFERCLSGKERMLGPDDRSTLRTAYNLAVLLYRQGRLEEAQRLFERSLYGLERALGFDHEYTLDSANGLALLLDAKGEAEAARKLYERTLSGFERLQGPDYSGTQFVLNNLALNLSKQGRLEEAKKLYERALSTKERVLGPDNASTLNSVHNLALLLIKQRQFEEAKKLCERALSGRERTMGSDHADTLITVLNLATIFDRQGRFEEAKRLYERALSGFTRIFGPNHEYTRMASQGRASIKLDYK